MPPSSDQDNRRIGRGLVPAPPGVTEVSFELVLDADWVTPSIARDRVRSWLRGHRWSPGHLEDLVLAVSEAVSNSIEHGYNLHPETARHPLSSTEEIRVLGQIVTGPDGERHVEFSVRDHGRWIPPTGSDPTRGHGLTIMRACAAEVRVDHGPAGTTVRLRSSPVPPPPSVL